MAHPNEMVAKSPAQKVVLDYYRLVIAKQWDEWKDLWAEDAVQENPFMPDLPGLDANFVGRERIAFHYITVLDNRENHVFEIIDLHESRDGNTVIVEVYGRSDVPETGRPYHQRYVNVFRLENDLIKSLKEYFNPIIFQKAFEGFLVGDGAVEN